ncbi:MAG TPA: hypothetical protein VHR45_13260 [Thermoanaerobaculia bacterium]|nr:hypothetical protein [Thermoanaerobaculia bacterium]
MIDEPQEVIEKPRALREAGHGTPPLAPPPGELAALLAALSPGRYALYAQVRAAIDELESTVSWELLYYPPDDAAVLAERLERLAASIRRLPGRLAGCLAGLDSEGSGSSSEPIREEVEFYFESVMHMIEKDFGRMERALPGLGQATPDQIERLCDLAADLKGKFASSIMGATAALVSQGRWPSLEVEPVLFPETAEEIHRTHELTAVLRALLNVINELAERVPLSRIVARWRNSQRADQYALADLVVLRGQLGSLLQERVRRALYSGDYHQLRQREVQLAERVGELESLHRRSWRTSAREAAAMIAAELPRLEQLACEIAALTDVRQLKSLIGEDAMARLRGKIESARGGAAEPLVALLTHDDLRLFFAVLLTAVQRRAALAGRDHLAAADRAAPAQAAPPAGEPPQPAGERHPAPATPPVPAAAPIASGKQETLLADLRRRMAALQSPLNPRWNSFRLVLRMIDRHGRVPDAMVGASLPFIEELLADVAPDLRRLAPYRGLTADLADRFEGACRALAAGLRSPAAGEPTPQQELAQLQRLLAALETGLES